MFRSVFVVVAGSSGREAATCGGGKKQGCSLPLRLSWSIAAAFATPVSADPVPRVPDGIPPQIVPRFLEPGAPNFRFGVDQGSGGGGGGTGSGSGGGTSDGTTTRTRSGDLGGAGRTRLSALEGGEEAIGAVESMGVSGSALGSVCVLEGCKNLPANAGSTISGWFQMRNDTFLASVDAALRANPSLRDQIVPGLAGKNDLVTQSIAAAQYVKQGAESFQSRGILNPTVLDTRSYYQFGPQYGFNVARASESANLRSVLAGTSEATFSANGITGTMTVGDWRQKIVRQVGTAAYQTVLK